jgi:hypothetical protein
MAEIDDRLKEIATHQAGGRSSDADGLIDAL